VLSQALVCAEGFRNSELHTVSKPWLRLSLSKLADDAVETSHQLANVGKRTLSEQLRRAFSHRLL